MAVEAEARDLHQILTMAKVGDGVGDGVVELGTDMDMGFAAVAVDVGDGADAAVGLMVGNVNIEAVWQDGAG